MTQTTPASIDLDTRTVTRTVRIRASRAAVWRALTEAEHIARWFGDDAELDAATVGARGRLHWEGHGWFPIEVVEAEPEAAFAFLWQPSEGSDEQATTTTVRFTLEADGDATILCLVETGFGQHGQDGTAMRAEMEDNRQGWDEELDELAAYVEATLA